MNKSWFAIISIVLLFFTIASYAMPNSYTDLGTTLPSGIKKITAMDFFENTLWIAAYTSNNYSELIQYNYQTSSIASTLNVSNIPHSVNGIVNNLYVFEGDQIYSVQNSTGTSIVNFNTGNFFNLNNTFILNMSTGSGLMFIGGYYGYKLPYFGFFGIGTNITNESLSLAEYGQINTLSVYDGKVLVGGILANNTFLAFYNLSNGNFNLININQTYGDYIYSTVCEGTLYLLTMTSSMYYLLSYYSIIQTFINMSYLLPSNGLVGDYKGIYSYKNDLFIVGGSYYTGFINITLRLFMPEILDSNLMFFNRAVLLNNYGFVSGNASSSPVLYSFSTNMPSKIGVSIYPKTVKITNPENVTFTANVTINGTYIYMWYINNTLVENTSTNNFTYYFDHIGVYNINMYVESNGIIIGSNSSMVIFYSNSTTSVHNNPKNLDIYVLGTIFIALVAMEIWYIIGKKRKKKTKRV
ncbi:MAG: hypothetical protein ACP5RS_02860 [Thermoplasmata archaeon]